MYGVCGLKPWSSQYGVCVLVAVEAKLSSRRRASEAVKP
jgi:hypothetical protein